MKPAMVKALSDRSVSFHTLFSQWRWRRSGAILPLALLVAPMTPLADPQDLAKAKDCFSCHKIENSRLGPSFMDIAHQFAGDQAQEGRSKLIRLIREGTADPTNETLLPPQPIVATLSRFETGHQWRKVTMPPQPQVNKEEAEQLADWILSLKK